MFCGCPGDAASIASEAASEAASEVASEAASEVASEGTGLPNFPEIPQELAGSDTPPNMAEGSEITAADGMCGLACGIVQLHEYMNTWSDRVNAIGHLHKAVQTCTDCLAESPCHGAMMQ